MIYRMPSHSGGTFFLTLAVLAQLFSCYQRAIGIISFWDAPSQDFSYASFSYYLPYKPLAGYKLSSLNEDVTH